MLRAVGVRSQRNDLAAQFPVNFQPLPVRQRLIAPVAVQFDAPAVFDQGFQDLPDLFLVVSKLVWKPRISLKYRRGASDVP